MRRDAPRSTSGRFRPAIRRIQFRVTVARLPGGAPTVVSWYFVAPDGMLMAARIDATPSFSAGIPEPLFRVAVLPGNNRTYAVARDGQRFLVPVELSLPLRVVLDCTLSRQSDATVIKVGATLA